MLRQSDVLNLYFDICDREAVNDICDREAVNAAICDRKAVKETWRATGRFRRLEAVLTCAQFPALGRNRRIR